MFECFQCTLQIVINKYSTTVLQVRIILEWDPHSMLCNDSKCSYSAFNNVDTLWANAVRNTFLIFTVHTSPPDAPRIPSLSRPSGEIKEGRSVTLTCISDANPAATYTWYKRNGNRNVPPLSERPQLVFSSLQSSDSGQYFCSATNELRSRPSENIRIDVKCE